MQNVVMVMTGRDDAEGRARSSPGLWIGAAVSFLVTFFFVGLASQSVEGAGAQGAKGK
jgi:hypothetical protein